MIANTDWAALLSDGIPWIAVVGAIGGIIVARTSKPHELKSADTQSFEALVQSYQKAREEDQAEISRLEVKVERCEVKHEETRLENLQLRSQIENLTRQVDHLVENQRDIQATIKERLDDGFPESHNPDGGQ